MIIDNYNVFSDSVPVVAGDSEPVCLMPFVGRGEPVYVTIAVSGDIDNLTALTVNLQQCDTRDGVYADVGAGVSLGLAELKAGCFRFELPDNAVQSYLRLNYVLTGAEPSQGKIFAALTRDVQLPYVKGQFIDGGRVVA